MGWECRDCGRVHDVDPETCACGSGDLRFRDVGESRLERARQRLLEPGDAGIDLLGGGPYVSLAFRLIVAFTVLLSVTLLLTVLL